MIKYQNGVIIISSDFTMNQLVCMIGGLEFYINTELSWDISVELIIDSETIKIQIELFDKDDYEWKQHIINPHKNLIVFSGEHNGFVDDEEIYILKKDDAYKFINSKYTQEDILKTVKKYFE